MGWQKYSLAIGNDLEKGIESEENVHRSNKRKKKANIQEKRCLGKWLGYLQVLKDLCFLSNSARPSTSASKVSGDWYLKKIVVDIVTHATK